MKIKKRKKMSLKEATNQLSGLLGEQLNKIPPKERRARVESAYKKLVASLQKKRPSSSDETAKGNERGQFPAVRLVARSRS